MNFYLKLSIAYFICFISFVGILHADTTLSRDGNGQNIQGAAFGSIKSKSLGTKGFACFSTTSKLSWEVKVSASTLTDSAALAFKYFINGSETEVYPMTDKFFQWQNAPTSKSPTITKACLRCYSSATEKTAYGIFQ